MKSTCPHLRISDLVEAYGFTARYWTKLAAAGKIPSARREGASWHFDEDAVNKWWADSDAFDAWREACTILGVSLERAKLLAARGTIPTPHTFEATQQLRQHFAEQVRPMCYVGYIYFIDWPPEYIKIGFAASVEQRLTTLQSGTPCTLRLIHSTPGTIAREAEILDAFRDLKVRGEWFKDHPDIRAFIEETKKQHSPFAIIRKVAE